MKINDRKAEKCLKLKVNDLRTAYIFADSYSGIVKLLRLDQFGKIQVHIHWDMGAHFSYIFAHVDRTGQISPLSALEIRILLVERTGGEPLFHPFGMLSRPGNKSSLEPIPILSRLT